MTSAPRTLQYPGQVITPHEATRHQTALLESALHYACRGWPVFPLHSVEADHCSCRRDSCRNAGKHPRTEHGLLDATTDLERIRSWWTAWPDANVGIPTGAATFVVLDVDPEKGGTDSLAALVAQHGQLPATVEAATGGGGRHLCFQHPGGHLPNSASTLGPGLDTRGDGGYIVAAPSRHRSGRWYEWELSSHPDEVPLAPLPDWILTRLTASSNRNGAGPHAEPVDESIPEGARNATLASLAGTMRRRGMTAEEILDALRSVNQRRCVPPLGDDELQQIAASIGRYAPAEPRPEPQPEVDDSLPPLGIGLGEFLAQTFPPLEPIVEGLLYTDGGGWIGGEEKLGKSYYAVEEALSIALGLPVCGRFPVPQRRRVFFIEEEDPPRRLHARVNALLRGKGLDPTSATLRAELDGWMRLAVWTGFSFDAPDLVARLDVTCRTFRPAVLYGDVLRKLTLRDLNKSAEAGALLATLDGLRRTHGVVFRILHHYRKTQGFRAGRGSQELGGSFQLGAWAENSLFFEPIGRKHGAVKVEVQSKDAPPAPAFTLIFESEGPVHDPTWVRLRAEELTETSVRARNLDAVLQALGTVPPSAAVEGLSGVLILSLVAALKLSDKTIRGCLKDLEVAGKAAVVGKASKGAALWRGTGQ
jgi:hypothetical protein